MDYTPEQIEEAKALVKDLESFSNKHVAIAANLKRVTDKSRQMVIAELLVNEYGVGILNKGIFKLFGEDTLTSVTNYR